MPQWRWRRGRWGRSGEGRRAQLLGKSSSRLSITSKPSSQASTTSCTCFTCLTSTKVQILSGRVAEENAAQGARCAEASRCAALSLGSFSECWHML